MVGQVGSQRGRCQIDSGFELGIRLRIMSFRRCFEPGACLRRHARRAWRAKETWLVAEWRVSSLSARRLARNV